MPDLPYSHEASDARIKRLMAQVGMPDSTSLMLAMKQLEQEVRLDAERPRDLDIRNPADRPAIKQAIDTEVAKIKQWINDLQFEKVLPAITTLIEERDAAEAALVLIGEKAVVDFDDPTVGQVDAVVKNREKYKEWLSAVLARAETHEIEKEQLRRWVADLQSGMFVNCVYCGHRYGPKGDTPVSMADMLKRHIAQCPKHPLSIARNALSSLIQAKSLKERDGKTPEYEKARDAAWKLADEAMKAIEG